MANTHKSTRPSPGYNTPVPAHINTSERAPAYRFAVQAQDELDKIFGGVFRDLLRPWMGEAAMPEAAPLLPSMDVSSTPEAYTINVELPGVDPDDVCVEVKDEMLIIKGEKHKEIKDVSAKKEKDEKQDEVKEHFSERYFGSFQRVLSLPDDADVDNIKATHKNGILCITIPRKTPEAPQSKTIAISKG